MTIPQQRSSHRSQLPGQPVSRVSNLLLFCLTQSHESNLYHPYGALYVHFHLTQAEFHHHTVCPFNTSSEDLLLDNNIEGSLSGPAMADSAAAGDKQPKSELQLQKEAEKEKKKQEKLAKFQAKQAKLAAQKDAKKDGSGEVRVLAF